MILISLLVFEVNSKYFHLAQTDTFRLNSKHHKTNNAERNRSLRERLGKKVKEKKSEKHLNLFLNLTIEQKLTFLMKCDEKYLEILDWDFLGRFLCVLWVIVEEFYESFTQRLKASLWTIKFEVFFPSFNNSKKTKSGHE